MKKYQQHCDSVEKNNNLLVRIHLGGSSLLFLSFSVQILAWTPEFHQILVRHHSIRKLLDPGPDTSIQDLKHYT